jgi:hypothetical protein
VAYTAVSMTLLRPTPGIQLYKLCSKSQSDSGVDTPLCQHDTAVPGELEFERLWLPLKEISIKKNTKANCTTLWLEQSHNKCRGYLRIVFGHIGVIDTAEAKISDFIVKYFREFEVICKKALTCVSGAKEKLFDEKT